MVRDYFHRKGNPSVRGLNDLGTLLLLLLPLSAV